MGHPRFEARRKPGNLRSPIGQQRCRRYQKGRFSFVSGLVLQRQQQRQDLNGLAETHVVGKAGSEPELGE